MPISAHLLERAYQLVDANQLQNAELVLDAVVRVDPKNVMAWKAYLQIYQDRNDLEWLMDRILKNKELSDKDKADIRAYHDYLIQVLNKCKQNTDEAKPRRIYSVKPEQEAPAQDGTIIFELIDEFDFPACKIEREKRKRPRQLFKYNIPLYVWQAVALLALFYAGIRLLVLGYLFGYLLMGVFIIGGVIWIRSINDHKTIAPINITRAYSLESENDLFIIDNPNVDARTDIINKDSSADIRYLDK